MKYDEYNREERSLCAHLFRLLHEKLAQTPEKSGVAEFVRAIRNGKPGMTPDPEKLRWQNISIHCEVALIRDAYCARKPSKGEPLDKLHSHMDELVQIISDLDLEGTKPDHRYSELALLLEQNECDLGLNDPSRTHPKQLAMKGRSVFSKADQKIYGVLQAMFNAKPDLAITVDDWLIVIEAKLTEQFKDAQMKLATKIAEVWRRHYFKDLGFRDIPNLCVLCIGLEKRLSKQEFPSVSWESVAKIATVMYPDPVPSTEPQKRDRSRIAFDSAVEIGRKLLR